MITAVCERMGVPCRLRFVGISRGVCLGLIKMSERFLFEKYLLINMPRMINFHKTTKATPEKSLVFVYGGGLCKSRFFAIISYRIRPQGRLYRICCKANILSRAE